MEKKKLIIFIDSGDTIIDEGTEIRNTATEVISADGIPGAFEMIKTLYEKGYRICLVADGLAQSFKNMFLQNHIYDYFEALIYSEPLKAEKPNPRMFKAAMGAMELTEDDLPRIIMVGNNLARDVKGANAMGITSVFLDWTQRYPKEPADDSEKPDYTIHMPMDLVELAESLNAKL